MEPYCSDPLSASRPLPVIERLAASVMALPTGLQLGERAISRIGDILSDAIQNAGAVRSCLGHRQAA
jgi:hypothetical protein